MTWPRKVAILGGGGVMGHGIALACLQRSDAVVSIISRREETVEHGLGLILEGRFGLARGVAKGRITEEQAADARSRLSGTTSYEEGLAGV
ncbi:MAG: 3-hydroxyacyl-CoA dehydrogenase NAD-binding domain-containing protein, partial [Acidimicrobiia bacterium]